MKRRRIIVATDDDEDSSSSSSTTSSDNGDESRSLPVFKKPRSINISSASADDHQQAINILRRVKFSDRFVYDAADHPLFAKKIVENVGQRPLHHRLSDWNRRKLFKTIYRTKNNGRLFESFQILRKEFEESVEDIVCSMEWRHSVCRVAQIPPNIWSSIVTSPLVTRQDVKTLFPNLAFETIDMLVYLPFFQSGSGEGITSKDDTPNDNERHVFTHHKISMDVHEFSLLVATISFEFYQERVSTYVAPPPVSSIISRLFGDEDEDDEDDQKHVLDEDSDTQQRILGRSKVMQYWEPSESENDESGHSNVGLTNSTIHMMKSLQRSGGGSRSDVESETDIDNNNNEPPTSFSKFISTPISQQRQVSGMDSFALLKLYLCVMRQIRDSDGQYLKKIDKSSKTKLKMVQEDDTVITTTDGVPLSCAQFICEYVPARLRHYLSHPKLLAPYKSVRDRILKQKRKTSNRSRRMQLYQYEIQHGSPVDALGNLVNSGNSTVILKFSRKQISPIDVSQSITFLGDRYVKMTGDESFSAIVSFDSRSISVSMSTQHYHLITRQIIPFIINLGTAVDRQHPIPLHHIQCLRTFEAKSEQHNPLLATYSTMIYIISLYSRTRIEEQPAFPTSCQDPCIVYFQLLPRIIAHYTRDVDLWTALIQPLKDETSRLKWQKYLMGEASFDAQRPETREEQQNCIYLIQDSLYNGLESLALVYCVHYMNHDVFKLLFQKFMECDDLQITFPRAWEVIMHSNQKHVVVFNELEPERQYIEISYYNRDFIQVDDNNNFEEKEPTKRARPNHDVEPAHMQIYLMLAAGHAALASSFITLVFCSIRTKTRLMRTDYDRLFGVDPILLQYNRRLERALPLFKKTREPFLQLYKEVSETPLDPQRVPVLAKNIPNDDAIHAFWNLVEYLSIFSFLSPTLPESNVASPNIGMVQSLDHMKRVVSNIKNLPKEARKIYRSLFTDKPCAQKVLSGLCIPVITREETLSTPLASLVDLRVSKKMDREKKKEYADVDALSLENSMPIFKTGFSHDWRRITSLDRVGSSKPFSFSHPDLLEIVLTHGASFS